MINGQMSYGINGRTSVTSITNFTHRDSTHRGPRVRARIRTDETRLVIRKKFSHSHRAPTRRSPHMSARVAPSRPMPRHRRVAPTATSTRAPAVTPSLPSLARAVERRRREDAAPNVVRVLENEIIVVDDALSRATCEEIIRTIEDGNGFAHATSRGPKYGEAWRSNGRYAREDETFARALWDAVDGKRTFEFELDDASGFNPNIRVYKYAGDTGDHFGPHVDERVTVRGRRSGYTALVYLSGEDVEGGCTIFYDYHGVERARVEPKTGRALYFRHGANLPEHEGELVRRGTKYVLRSDVLF